MAYKYYAVKSGLTPGVYLTWEECKVNVIGVPSSDYRGFNCEIEAHEYIYGTKSISKTSNKHSFKELKFREAIAYVDGSYTPKTNTPTYGVVFINNGQENRYSGIVEDKSLYSMRNVAGEIEAAIKAMEIAKISGIKKLTIYHDYNGISAWCTGKWKTNKAGTKKYKDLYDQIKKHMDIKFIHVKGHSGDYYNNLADSLAAEMQTRLIG